jgi:hypothetical protein
MIVVAAVALSAAACGGAEEPPKGDKVVYQAPGGKAVTYDDLVEQVRKQTPELGGDESCTDSLEGHLKNSTLKFPNGEMLYLEACYAGKAARRAK